MNRHFIIGLSTITIANCVEAQSTELLIHIERVTLDRGQITAELRNPTGTVLAVISDLGFTMNGWDITNFQYNPAFDSDFFGPATVTTTPSQVDFLGLNTLPPLNNGDGARLDSSNPLTIATFETRHISAFELIGQITGAYKGIPFPNILTYLNADGIAGNIPYRIQNDYTFPAPGTAVVLCLAGTGFVRRRR